MPTCGGLLIIASTCFHSHAILREILKYCSLNMHLNISYEFRALWINFLIYLLYRLFAEKDRAEIDVLTRAGVEL